MKKYFLVSVIFCLALYSCKKEIIPPITDNDSLAMGNPSGAVASISSADNYLVQKYQYALSYNDSKGEANWVSWRLSNEWLGNTPRCDCFQQDATLPSSFYYVQDADYTGSGFDRGHMCPSADRDISATDNAATFLMSNIMPQAPNLNQQPWAKLEDYCRKLAVEGNELYIISGGYGTGGTGSNGGTTNTFAGGKINVPSHCWKIVVVLLQDTGDASRVNASTRIIAVDMPNTQTANSHIWGYYRISVDAIETLTGYDFLSNVPVPVQNVVEAAVDTGPTQ